jgi:hypothetical protein
MWYESVKTARCECAWGTQEPNLAGHETTWKRSEWVLSLSWWQ